MNDIQQINTVDGIKVGSNLDKKGDSVDNKSMSWPSDSYSMRIKKTTEMDRKDSNLDKKPIKVKNNEKDELEPLSVQRKVTILRKLSNNEGKRSSISVSSSTNLRGRKESRVEKHLQADNKNKDSSPIPLVTNASYSKRVIFNSNYDKIMSNNPSKTHVSSQIENKTSGNTKSGLESTNHEQSKVKEVIPNQIENTNDFNASSQKFFKQKESNQTKPKYKDYDKFLKETKLKPNLQLIHGTNKDSGKKIEVQTPKNSIGVFKELPKLPVSLQSSRRTSNENIDSLGHQTFTRIKDHKGSGIGNSVKNSSIISNMNYLPNQTPQVTRQNSITKNDNSSHGALGLLGRKKSREIQADYQINTSKWNRSYLLPTLGTQSTKNNPVKSLNTSLKERSEFGNSNLDLDKSKNVRWSGMKGTDKAREYLTHLSINSHGFSLEAIHILNEQCENLIASCKKQIEQSNNRIHIDYISKMNNKIPQSYNPPTISLILSKCVRDIETNNRAIIDMENEYQEYLDTQEKLKIPGYSNCNQRYIENVQNEIESAKKEVQGMNDLIKDSKSESSILKKELKEKSSPLIISVVEVYRIRNRPA